LSQQLIGPHPEITAVYPAAAFLGNRTGAAKPSKHSLAQPDFRFASSNRERRFIAPSHNREVPSPGMNA
jgi:hypothetical protein